MAVPPSYSDLGKAAKDLLNKGYNYGSVKLEVKTKTSNGIGITAGGSNNLASGKVAGNIETKWACAEQGLTVTKKWNTDNTINSEIALENKGLAGLKLTLDSSIGLESGNKAGVLKLAYKRDHINLGADLGLTKSPLINGSAVVGYQGLLAGYQMAFETATSKLTKSNIALGYKVGNTQFHACCNNLNEFGGSLHHKVDSTLETAFNVSYASGASPAFAIAAKKAVDDHATIQFKVNNAAQVGVAYSQELKPGVKLTMSSMTDAKNFSAGGHQIGFGIDIAA